MKQITYRLYTSIREHQEGCSFFDGFGLMTQAIMGSIVFSSLIFKWFIEKPRRKFLIFALDSTKQIAGQLTQHILNLFASLYVDDNEGMQCEWYAVNLINDMTIGILLQYIVLLIFTTIFRKTRFAFNSGDYGDDNISINFIIQLALWVLVVIIVNRSINLV